MGHFVDRCDVLDMLEEAAVTHRPVSVVLKGGEHFVDEVRDVVTQDHVDRAVFRTHEPVVVDHVSRVARVDASEPSYAGKRG